MKLKMMAGSDTGTARAVNEDFCGIFEEQGLAIVCDGMGGHNAGANASQLAVTTLRYMYLFLDPAIHYQLTRDLVAKDLGLASRLIGAIRLTNRNVYNKSIKEHALRGMGTTVSALAIQNNTAVLAHVGDSRIYRFRQGTMNLLTEDHTWLNELIQDQEIDRAEAEKFEKKNVITRAIGLTGAIKIDVGIDPVQRGDLFLICTDGLTRALSDEEINRIVLFNNGNLDHSLRQLIDTAMMKDGSDNITVALVAVEAVDPASVDLKPTYFTLKAENKQLTLLEDKILRRELYNRSNSEASENSIKKILKHYRSKFTWIVAVFALVFLVGVYAASNHRSQQKSAQSGADQNRNRSNDAIKDTIKAPGLTNSPMNQAPPKLPLKIESKVAPDSLKKKLITASIENQEYGAHVSKIQSRSLQKNVNDRGKIFLIGLEKMNQNGNAALFINNNYWGKTEDWWNKGLSLMPGAYTMIIRDSTNNILFQQSNIVVAAGDIKAIEIKGR